MERVVYHIVHEADQWLVQREGANGPISRHKSKEQAIGAGRAKAKKAPLSQIVVHKRDGTIEEEFTYGADPRGIPG